MCLKLHTCYRCAVQPSQVQTTHQSSLTHAKATNTRRAAICLERPDVTCSPPEPDRHLENQTQLVRKRLTADNAAGSLTSNVRRHGRYALFWIMLILQSRCYRTSCTNPLFAGVLSSLEDSPKRRDDSPEEIVSY